MIEFKVLKESKKSKARLGALKTKHGGVETPCLVPVATQGVVKTLTNKEVKEAKTQILIANTFHLHLRPTEEIIKKSGGIHKFMNCNMPIMTDSGGFQVFSFGFGRDFGVGKKLKGKSLNQIKEKSQPKSLKITDEGVYFKSLIDGRKLFLGPKESIKIQESLGADIIFAFDECTPPLATKEYIASSLKKTHRWAEICLKEKKSRQAIFGIIQGSKFKDLRQKSAKFIASLGFDGWAVGGDLGESKKTTASILNWTLPFLDKTKPRHLLGIGKLDDIENIIKCGVDFFDCTVPTHYGRRGIAYTESGVLNLNQSKFLKDKNPLDKKCSCWVCGEYRRNYISHLIKAKEITGLRLVSFHNLYFFNSFIEKIREKIRNGKL
ncbi:MAG: tRNA guanosine(34) transglycosylase Tgt [Candidatus Pacebacteria bacterium]|nr:tRNA guanosine(34) transglycosylase Tgt [Candidatus Paceibacterota bacterium]